MPLAAPEFLQKIGIAALENERVAISVAGSEALLSFNPDSGLTTP